MRPIKGGNCRTGSRTPGSFTPLDATIISAPTNNNTNHNGRLDFMNQHAVLPGAATAASANEGTCTSGWALICRYALIRCTKPKTLAHA